MIPWSYSEDIKVLENNHLTAKEISNLLGDKRSAQLANRRRIQLKDIDVGGLILEEIFITNNYETMSEKEIAKKLNTTLHYVQLRVMSLISEGKIEGEKPKITKPIYNLIPVEIEPMKKEMVVEYNAAPKQALSKVAIQEDLLEPGKTYMIIFDAGLRKVRRYTKHKLKLIGCYPEHYLFIDDKGTKQSLTKRDYYLKEWKFEEVN